MEKGYRELLEKARIAVKKKIKGKGRYLKELKLKTVKTKQVKTKAALIRARKLELMRAKQYDAFQDYHPHFGEKQPAPRRYIGKHKIK